MRPGRRGATRLDSTSCRRTVSPVVTGPGCSDELLDESTGTLEMVAGWGRFPVRQGRVSARNGSVSRRARANPAAWPRPRVRRRGGAAAPDDLVIDTTRADNIVDFDPATGRVDLRGRACRSRRCCACSCRAAGSRPSRPGTSYVTIGGAIAADVHGKNHHCDGSFGNFVVAFDLLDRRRRAVECDPAREPEPFKATLGGMGLTGHVTGRRSACARSSARGSRTRPRRSDLDECSRHSARPTRRGRTRSGWIDCLAQGRAGPRRADLRRPRHAASRSRRRAHRAGRAGPCRSTCPAGAEPR